MKIEKQYDESTENESDEQNETDIAKEQFTQTFRDLPLDNMLNDIIEIFHLDGVQLVRLNGLSKRARRISGFGYMDNEEIRNLLAKMKHANIISWNYVYKCPMCNEVFYQLDNTPSDKVKICDTCKHIFIPKENLYKADTIIV